MRSSSISSMVAPICLVASQTTHWMVGQQVQTKSGTVSGHGASQLENVSEYLGIPYAEPPTGDLRFAEPVALDQRDARLNGSAFGFSCPGSIIYPLSPNATGLTPQGSQIYNDWNQVGDKHSEDCLTLNIWTKPQTGEEAKAVLVWIYGGGLFTGGTSVPLYNGARLADEQDVVVVSVNYRLNMFGFPGSPAAPRQNLGILDQRLALEWVRDNIAAFGGDPRRIVLFGQSAGSSAVDMHAYAFPDDPIASGVILQSGTAASYKVLGQRNTTGAAALWATAAANLGCGDAGGDDDAVLACMRAKPAVDILNVQFNPAAIGNATAAPIGGLFIATTDGELVFDDYESRATFAGVPVLVGNTANEGGISAALSAANAGRGFNRTVDTTSFLAQVHLTCPAAARANLSVSAGVPAWRYEYHGSFPNTQLLEGVDSGAWHGSELGVLFDTNQGVVDNTAAEDRLGMFMRGMWAAFAKKPSRGLLTYGADYGIAGGLPTYNSSELTLIQLGVGSSAGITLSRGNSADKICT